MERTVLAMAAPVLSSSHSPGVAAAFDQQQRSSTTASASGDSDDRRVDRQRSPGRDQIEGQLAVATEAQYAPLEFIASDGHTVSA